MVKEIRIGTNYYFNIKIPASQIDTPDYSQGVTISTTTKFRLNGGAWQTRNGTFYFDYSGLNEGYEYYDGSWHYLNENDIFEFVGIISLVNINGFPFLKDLLLDSAIPNPIGIDLFKLNCEPNVVNKLSGTNLLFVNIMYGALREEVNVLTPSITIQYDKVPDFNYVYISSLQRYYFVTNITCVRGNIYKIDLKVDVLTTYNADIRKQYAFISRCETIYFSAYKIDERIPLNKIPTINLTKMTSATSIRVFEPKQNDSSIKNIALTIVGTSALAQISKTLNKPTYATNLPDVHSYLGHSASLVTYAISLSDWKTISDLLLTNNTLASYIASVIMYPFALNNDCNVDAGLIPISLGSTSTGVSGYYMYGHLSDYTRQFVHTFTKRFLNERDFLNYAPYYKYEMYIPYKGYIELDGNKVSGKTIGLYYVHNYQNGVSMAIVYNETDNYILDSYQVSVGTLLSVTTTNSRENQNQRDSATLNMIMGLVGSAVQMGSGAMSDKFGAVLGGGLTGAKAVMSKLNSDMYIYERGNTTLSSDLTNNFTIMDGWVRETYFDLEMSFVPNFTQFKKLNGYKWGVYGTLEDVLGMGSDHVVPTGYTEIPEMHYKPNTQTYITKTEIDEIVSLARDGIIL